MMTRAIMTLLRYGPSSRCGMLKRTIWKQLSPVSFRNKNSNPVLIGPAQISRVVFDNFVCTTGIFHQSTNQNQVFAFYTSFHIIFCLIIFMQHLFLFRGHLHMKSIRRPDLSFNKTKHIDFNLRTTQR